MPGLLIPTTLATYQQILFAQLVKKLIATLFVNPAAIWAYSNFIIKPVQFAILEREWKELKL